MDHCDRALRRLVSVAQFTEAACPVLPTTANQACGRRCSLNPHRPAWKETVMDIGQLLADFADWAFDRHANRLSWYIRPPVSARSTHRRGFMA